jgi:hypothetical protein
MSHHAMMSLAETMGAVLVELIPLAIHYPAASIPCAILVYMTIFTGFSYSKDVNEPVSIVVRQRKLDLIYSHY